MTSERLLRGTGGLLLLAAAVVCLAVIAQAQDIQFVQQGLEESRYSFNASLNVPAEGAATLQVVFDYKDPQTHYVLAVGGGAVQFQRIQGGTTADIGLPAKVQLTPGDHTLVLQRRPWRMSCVFDNVVVASAYDAALSGGDVGFTATGLTVKDPFVQPIATTLDETDDFMRTGKEGNPWHTVTGSWEYKRLRVEDPQKQDDTRAANAFSYFGSGKDATALCVYGLPNEQGFYPYWFWDDYSFSCAVRSEGSPVGAVFFYQGPTDYMLFRWTSLTDQDGGKKQLIAVVKGQPQVLAEKPGGFLPHQWYAVRVNTSDGLVECFVDDELQMVARTDLFGQGQVGLYVEGEQGASFDDTRVERYEVVADRFDQEVPGKWLAQSGRWQWEKRGGVASSAKEPAILSTGAPGWADYILAATARAEGNSAVGLVFDDGDQGRYVFRWAPAGSKVDYAGQAQLIKVLGDQTTVLASTKADIPRNKPHRLKVSCVEGYMVASVDDQTLLEQVDFDLPKGRIGLYADGPGDAYFGDAYLRFYREKPPVEISPQFQSPGDDSMVEWATKQGQWLPPQAKNAPYWYKGEFFGDSRVEFKIPGVGQRNGSVTITLAPDQSKPEAGYQIVLETAANQPVLKCKLLAAGAVAEQGQADAPEGQTTVAVRIERRGAFLLTFINDKCILKYRMTQPQSPAAPSGVG